MNDFLIVFVVAAFMAITAVFISTFSLVLSINYGIAPSLADCGLVVVLCLGAFYLESLVVFARARIEYSNK